MTNCCWFLVWRKTGAVRNARPSRGQAAVHPEEVQWKKGAKPPRVRLEGELSECLERNGGLAEQHPPVSEALTSIAGSVRNTAIVLAVLVATRSAKPI